MLLSGIAIAAMMVAAMAAGGTTEAASTTVDIPLLGSNEAPPVSGPGTGFARVSFDSSTSVLSYQITVSGISGDQVTAAHIHRGAVGVSGPIVYTLASAGFTTLEGEETLTPADVADLMAGNFYINVHSETNPNGFARGQLLLDPGSAVKQALKDLQNAYNAKDVAGLVARVTDRGLQESFEEPDRASALQDLPNFIGEPPITITPVGEVQFENGRASVNVILDFQLYKEPHRFSFIMQNGVWMLDGDQPAQVATPAGSKTVNLTLDEFNFQYDKSAVNGNVTFQVKNAGDQAHEVDLVSLAPGVNLQQVLNNADPDSGPPAGVEDVVHGGPYEPGSNGTVLLSQPLAPGRYAFLCFLTDPATGLPHALLGMTSEFTVGGGSGGSVSPPNTGDGGLIPSGGMGSLGYLALLIAGASVAGAVVTGYRQVRR
jgi:hypothetical protein